MLAYVFITEADNLNLDLIRDAQAIQDPGFADKLSADLKGGVIEPEPVLEVAAEAPADFSFGFGETFSFDFGTSAEAGDPALEDEAEAAAHDEADTAFDFSAEALDEVVEPPAASFDLASLSPFQAKTGMPLAAIAAAAWSWVEKILHELQRTVAPSSTSVSIKTAVWIVM